MASGVDKELIAKSASRASRFLKSISNEHRLLVLCNLVESEKTVSELAALIGINQPTLSQQLARLRADGLVATRRSGKSIHYSLASDHARAMLGLLFELFCAPAAKRASPRSAARTVRPTRAEPRTARTRTRAAA